MNSDWSSCILQLLSELQDAATGSWIYALARKLLSCQCLHQPDISFHRQQKLNGSTGGLLFLVSMQRRAYDKKVTSLIVMTTFFYPNSEFSDIVFIVKRHIIYSGSYFWICGVEICFVSLNSGYTRAVSDLQASRTLSSMCPHTTYLKHLCDRASKEVFSRSGFSDC